MTVEERTHIEEKAQFLLEAVDNEYSIPTYFEDRVKNAIVKALIELKKKEGEEK